MKKLLSMILSFICVVGLVGCNSQSNEYEQLVEENAMLKEQVSKLSKLEDITSGQVFRISGGFEALVREKIPGYMLDESTPTAVVVTMFQSGPTVLNLGAELAEQVEEGNWYYFTIEDRMIELNIDPEDPVLFIKRAFPVGTSVMIRSVTPCEPTGLEGNHLQYSME